MGRSGGFFIIVIGLLLAYAAITGKLECWQVLFTCLQSDKGSCQCGMPSANITINNQIPPLPSLPSLTGFG